VTCKPIVKSLDLPDLLSPWSAMPRSRGITDGKPNSSRIGPLQVWQRQNGDWKLLAQQG
jgi:hypothetical protein